MNNFSSKISIVILLVLFSIGVKAQEVPTVRAKIDSSNIMLGDQVHLTFELEKLDGTTVVFPQFADTLMQHVEVLEGPILDTLKQDEKTLLRAEYLITSFDSGQYKIPRYPLLLQRAGSTDTLYTPSVMLQVHNMKLQKQDGIVDIKTPYEAPITLAEVTPWILGFLLLVSLVLIILYAIYRYKNKKPFFAGPIEPEEPCEIKAARLLEELKQHIPTVPEEVKPFYVSLTDVVREYMSNRFGVSTLELTTDEIIDVLRSAESTKGYQAEFKMLEPVLRLADMVKFAKYIPEESEHPRQLSVSIQFVENTKPVVEMIESQLDDTEIELSDVFEETNDEEPLDSLSEEQENLEKYGPQNNQE
ncbi:hypothetical protein K4L44_05600 [Halosquirtibacter laminarini]|uniref:Uncharacterized protein n=1 Tax=Halosquirtibacter laminarini TaxID=3374600 RepID=A0AC61NID7_9BACT|nr:hypothetical protein K4L44_05600 [Prolixibacteraceae bacterium]